MDYFGEPALPGSSGTGTHAWPYVSSDFGQFDIAGFPKPHAFWYTSNWLQAIPSTEPSRPPLPAHPVARILELPPPAEQSRITTSFNLSAITTAPYAQLYVDGTPLGIQPAAIDQFGAFTTMHWSVPPPRLPFANATLAALDGAKKNATVLATHTILAPKAWAHRLQLTIDVPSASTGTGDALLADGRDTAMIRAAVVDELGTLVSDATDRVEWRVVSGAGRVVGVSNGDPKSHEQMKSTAVNAWGGLARGFVQVSQDCVTPGRKLLSSIDVDASRSPTRVVPTAAECDTSKIVVAASSTRLGNARIAISVSTDAAKDSPLAVAAATAKGLPGGFSYIESFVG